MCDEPWPTLAGARVGAAVGAAAGHILAAAHAAGHACKQGRQKLRGSCLMYTERDIPAAQTAACAAGQACCIHEGQLLLQVVKLDTPERSQEATGLLLA